MLENPSHPVHFYIDTSSGRPRLVASEVLRNGAPIHTREWTDWQELEGGFFRPMRVIETDLLASPQVQTEVVVTAAVPAGEGQQVVHAPMPEPESGWWGNGASPPGPPEPLDGST